MTRGGNATYVYGLIAASRRPSLARVPRGLPAAGPVRLLELDDSRPRQWLVVATVPLARYGEAAIKRGLNDLAWVSRAAVGHERVIEAFARADAILPMKLFTIFSNDDRALEDIRRNRSRIAGLLRRVSGHHEWGVRMAFARVAGAGSANARRSASTTGAGYLAGKKATRDERAEEVRLARDAAIGLYEAAATLATRSKNRSVSELPGGADTLLLDAVFLVPTRREGGFKKTIARQAREARRSGGRVTLTGPWPPYSFVQD